MGIRKKFFTEMVVLVSPRIELIFLTVAGIVLCFRFRMRIMLMGRGEQMAVWC